MRIMRNLAMASVLLATGCVNVAPPLSANIPRAALVAQPVVRALERPPLFTRSLPVAESGLPGGVVGFIVSEARNAALNANNQNRTQINSIATPTEVDPAALIEEAIATHLNRNFATRPTLRDLHANNVRGTTVAERAPELTEMARRRGLSGILIDVYITAFGAESSGRDLGLRDEEFSVRVAANMAIYDIETGAVLVSGHCNETNTRPQLIADAIAGGVSASSIFSREAAQNCAKSLIETYLR
ncbi:MAG: hypothetical protein WD046_08575 [Paracoccaceae bacterium]